MKVKLSEGSVDRIGRRMEMESAKLWFSISGIKSKNYISIHLRPRKILGIQSSHVKFEIFQIT